MNRRFRNALIVSTLVLCALIATVGHHTSTVMPDVQAARPAGIQGAGASALTVWNLDEAQAATVVTDLYNQQGAAPTSLVLSPIPPLRADEIVLRSRQELRNGAYAALVSADRPVATYSRTDWSASGGRVLLGAPTSGSDVIVPHVLKNHSDPAHAATSLVTVHNTDPNAAASATIELYGVAGGAPLMSHTVQISPGASHTIDLGLDPRFLGVPDGFIGSMRITAATPLAVSVLEDRLTSTHGVAGYAGWPVDRAAERWLVPAVHAAYTGTVKTATSSAIAVTSAAAEPISVTLRYNGVAGTCAGQAYEHAVEGSLASHGTAVFAAAAAGDGVGTAESPLPDGCAAAAEIVSDGGDVTVTVLDVTSDTSRAAAYDGWPAATAAERLIVPAVHRDDDGLSSLVAVVAGAQANVTLTAFRADGSPVPGCGVACSATLEPGEGHRWWLPELDAVDDGFHGYAVLEADGPIAAVTMEQPGNVRVDSTAMGAIALGASTAQRHTEAVPLLLRSGSMITPEAPAPTRSPTATDRPSPTPTTQAPPPSSTPTRDPARTATTPPSPTETPPPSPTGTATATAAATPSVTPSPWSLTLPYLLREAP